MKESVRRFTAVAIAVAALSGSAATMPPPGAEAARLVAAAPDRADLARDLQRLAAAERQTLAELLELRLRVDRLEQSLEQLGREIALRQVRLDELRRQEERLAARLARVKDLAAKRLRVLYEEGQLGYLDVLLGAATFGDFVSRLGIIRDLIEYDQRVLSDLRRLRAGAAQAREELAGETDALAADQRRLQDDRDRRAAAAVELDRRLSALRGDRARFEARLAELDRAWAVAYPDLRELVDALLQVRPDLSDLQADVQVQFAPLRARIELTDAALSRYLEGKGVRRLRLTFTEQGLSIEGGGDAPVRVDGRLVPDGAGLSLQIDRVALHGLPVDRSAWEELFGRRRIVLQPISAPVAYRVKEVRTAPGRLIILIEA